MRCTITFSYSPAEAGRNSLSSVFMKHSSTATKGCPTTSGFCTLLLHHSSKFFVESFNMIHLLCIHQFQKYIHNQQNAL